MSIQNDKKLIIINSKSLKVNFQCEKRHTSGKNKIHDMRRFEYEISKNISIYYILFVCNSTGIMYIYS